MIKKSEKKNPKKNLNIFSWALGQGFVNFSFDLLYFFLFCSNVAL